MTDPNDELARLAQQGQARLAEAQHGQASEVDRAAERNIRVAVGGVRNSPLRRVMLVVGVLAGAATAAGFVVVAQGGAMEVTKQLGVLMPGIFVSAWMIVLGIWLPPLASRAAVAAERAWVAALPFRLENYFNVIAAKPEGECCLDVKLETSRPLARDTVQGVIALFDTRSTVLEVTGTQVRFRRRRSRARRASRSTAGRSTGTTGSARRCIGSWMSW